MHVELQGYHLRSHPDTDPFLTISPLEVSKTPHILSGKPQILRWEVAKKDTLLLMPLSKQTLRDWASLNPLSIATTMTPNPIPFGRTNTVGNTLWLKERK